jgi:4-amino-4-deoxy-L-arabinose transferase-like glycosyltransferase
MDMDAKFSPSTASNRAAKAIVLAACLFVFAAGQSFIPRLGIYNDEAVFANSLFRSDAAYYQVGRLPLMVTSYAGTLKTWLYAPIFGIFGTGPRALREPALIAAVLSIWLFFLLLRRIAGTRAAVVGACLLAADSDYLLTSVYDWGPVALQHVLLIGGVLLAVRYAQTRGSFALAGAFFLMGLAMWEKAIAIWLLSGMAIAAVVIYGRRLLELFTWRRAAIATSAFCLGALPLIIFNVHSNFETFRKNTVQDTIPVSAKAEYLLTAAKGGALFGYLVPDDWQTPAPHRPSSLLEKISASVSKTAGHPRRSGLIFLLAAALLAAPFAGARAIRAILFCLIAFGAAWIQMALNANTGGSIHHTILLWPLPQAVAAISLAALSCRLRRWGSLVLAAAIAVPICAGVLVTNEYKAQMVRNGGTAGWTPALFPLTDYMKAQPAEFIFCMDWGMHNTLLLESRGGLKLYIGTDPVMDDREPTADDLRNIRWMIEQPDAEFISHTPENEFFKEANERLVEAAAGLGYRKAPLATVSDGFGRKIFEVYRFDRP